jgi:hypothetical protein
MPQMQEKISRGSIVDPVGFFKGHYQKSNFALGTIQ